MTRVKICGITNLEDALCAARAGADFLGFIFFSKSPRYIEPERAAEITAALSGSASADARHTTPNSGPRFIGVFVNETPGVIEETLQRGGIDYAQLHGDEPPAVVESFQRRAFKALRPTSAAEASLDAEWYADLGPADGPQLLVDAYDPNEYGGTGKRADWPAAAQLARTCPRLVLAGGLTPYNVAAAVSAVQPWAVDVSSGVEIGPGRKDAAKVRAFIAAAKTPTPQADGGRDL